MDVVEEVRVAGEMLEGKVRTPPLERAQAAEGEVANSSVGVVLQPEKSTSFEPWGGWNAQRAVSRFDDCLVIATHTWHDSTGRAPAAIDEIMLRRVAAQATGQT